MKNKLVIFGHILVICSMIMAFPAHLLAAESASFLLYDELPNYAQRGPQEATSFLLNEDGLTWVALPVVGSHFQIVSGPPLPVSSSSSSSVSTSSVSSEASRPQGGGRREREGELPPSAPSAPTGTSSSSSTQSIPSSAPFMPSLGQADRLHQAPSLRPRADYGTAAAYQSSQGSDRAEQGTPGSCSLDSYFFYRDNCQLSDFDREVVVCVYRLYLVKLPDFSLLGTWGGVEIILHLADILLVLLGILLIGIALFFKWHRSDRQHQHKKYSRHSRRKR